MQWAQPKGRKRGREEGRKGGREEGKKKGGERERGRQAGRQKLKSRRVMVVMETESKDPRSGEGAELRSTLAARGHYQFTLYRSETELETGQRRASSLTELDKNSVQDVGGSKELRS